ncbi:DUF6966 domain-containing protein [Pseudomonas costantinii]|uniref:DUF6966 domain-containing protein n=1 Tax=Pseudomonas costantinii TaxID=168469 RepID=UPI0015A0F519|nr:hypothetical protein [Pseudomonas costantinii]NVZ70432.1 hypothetical protein [Pseudomonas costantinii]
MNQYESAVLILEEMATLLDMAGIQDWAEGLRRVGSYTESEAPILYSAVLRMYGGSGSLSDIVIYHKGKLLKEENDKFDELRSELYVICR